MANDAGMTVQVPDEDKPWIKLVQDAYSKSTTYFEANYNKQWEDGLRMFQSKHPRDSKYNSDNYKYRSRLFRPKTRSMVRKHEATASIAFFSSPDVINIDPVRTADPIQAASSSVMKEIMQYRLTKTIPWYLTVIGGLQDAMSVGIVCSFQYWKYQTRTEEREVKGFHPEMGEISFMQPQEVPVEDKPCVELLPVENIRFDPAASWYDVVNTSPYIILQMPMYLRDVLDKMETKNRQGEPWKSYSKDVIMSCKVEDDSVRAARNASMEDPQQQTSEINEFDVVMVYLNFIKVGGQTITYYTLKDQYLLTTPKVLAEVFLHNQIPVVIGFCVPETHKAVPTAPVILGRDLQNEANEVANQRIDNVKFVLNKRWVVRRGSNIDVESMLRNVPGGVTMANNVEQDLREINWQDVTSSAYQEQDRINVDYDELLGNFAQSSVMTNRRLNETVGGMKMMAQGANVITEYTLRVFAETWMEPVLRQILKLEQYYETDDVVLGVAADRAQLFQRFGQDPNLDTFLGQELTLSVNVGMGATDPDTRFQRFVQAMGAYAKLALEGSPDIALPEVRRELFGLAGFKDSQRFFTDVDPRLQQAQQLAQQAESQAKEIIDQSKMQMVERERKLDMRELELDVREIEIGAEEAKNEVRLGFKELKADVSAQAANVEGEARQASKQNDANDALSTIAEGLRMVEEAQQDGFSALLKIMAAPVKMGKDEQGNKQAIRVVK